MQMCQCRVGTLEADATWELAKPFGLRNGRRLQTHNSDHVGEASVWCMWM